MLDAMGVKVSVWTIVTVDAGTIETLTETERDVLGETLELELATLVAKVECDALLTLEEEGIVDGAAVVEVVEQDRVVK